MALIQFPTLGELMDKQRDELFEAWWQDSPWKIGSSFDAYNKALTKSLWDAGFEAHRKVEDDAERRAAMHRKAESSESPLTTRMVRVTHGPQQATLTVAKGQEITHGPNGEIIANKLTVVFAEDGRELIHGTIYFTRTCDVVMKYPEDIGIATEQPLPVPETPKRGREFI